MSSPAFKKRKSFTQNDSPQSPKKFKSEKVPNGRQSQGTPFKGKKHNKSFTDKSPATVVANIKKESVTPLQKMPKLEKFGGTGNLGTPKDGNIKKEPLSIKREPPSIQKEQLSAKKEQKKKQKINNQGGKGKNHSSSQGTEEKEPNRHQRRRQNRAQKRQAVKQKQKDLRTKVLEGDAAAKREMQEIVDELEKRPEKSKTAEKKLRYFTNLLRGDKSQPWRKTKQEKKKIIIENKNKKDHGQQVQPTKKDPQGQQNYVAQKPTQKQNQLSKKNKQKEALQKLPQPKIVSNPDISSTKSANKIKKQKIEDSDDDEASDEEEEVDNDEVKGESEDDDEEDEVSDEDSDSEIAAEEEDSGETSDDEASDDDKLTISNKWKEIVGGEDDEESAEEDGETSDDEASDDDKLTISNKFKKTTGGEEDEESAEEEDESSEEGSEDDTSNQVDKNKLPKQNVNKNKLQQQKVENKNKIKSQPNVKDILDKDKPGRYVVFVGNMPYTSTKEELREHFKKAGEIIDIRIPTGKDTNKPKGFAYVEVGDSDSYQKALSLHHTFLGGRRINVLYTQGGKKKSDFQKQEIKAKNFKLHAMRQQGQLAGSVKADQKRSVRRAKKRQFEKTE